MLGSGKFYKVWGSFVTSVTFWAHTRHSTVSAPHWGRRVRLSMVIVLLRVLPLAELYVYSWLSKTFPEFCNSSRSQFNLRDGVQMPFSQEPQAFKLLLLPSSESPLLPCRPEARFYLCFLSSFSCSFPKTARICSVFSGPRVWNSKARKRFF